MKRHTALPQEKNLQWIGQVIAQLVEQYIAQPATDHDAKYAIENQVFQVAHGQVGLDLSDTPSAQQPHHPRSEEHTPELQSLMRISYAVSCLNKKQAINKT